MTIDPRPCSCGDSDCCWNAAPAVLEELGWNRPARKPVAGAEPLSKPWVADHQGRANEAGQDS